MRKRMGKASELKVGGYVIIDGEPCEVVRVKKSTTAIGTERVYAEAVSFIDGGKRIMEAHATEEVEYPILELKPAQILSIGREKVTLFDLRNHSTLHVDLPRNEKLRKQLAINAEVDYAEIGGVRKIIQVGLYDAHSYT